MPNLSSLVTVRRPLTIQTSGQTTAVIGRVRDTLLALLCVEAGRVVPTEVPVDEAWNGKPPRTAAVALRYLDNLVVAMTFELTIDIAAPTPAVFNFVADLTTMPQWYSAIDRVDRVGDAAGLGARYMVDRQLPGGSARNEVAVTSYEQGREITFASQAGPTPFVYRYTVEHVDGGTRLVLNGTISGSGLPGGTLLGPLAERLFKHGMRDNLNTLKAILERQVS